MKKFKSYELKLWHILSCLSAAAIITAGFLVFPGIARAWSHIYNMKGAIQVSNDANVIAFISTRADSGDKVLIEDINGNRTWDFSASEKTLNTMALSGNGKYIAVTGKGVYLLSVTDKKTLWSYTQDGGMTIAVSQDGTVIVGGYSAKVYAFKKDSSNPTQNWNLGTREDRPKAVAVSGDGTLAAASTNKTFFVFDTNSSAIKWTAKPKEYVQDIKISNDGKYILGIGAHSVYYWNKNSSTPVWQKTWRGLLIGADMSSNGDKVAVSSQKEVAVFNSKGKELRHFENSFGNSDLQMSDNGRYIFVNGGSRRIYAFDDSYSTNELRPFRIIQNVNSGGHSKTVIGSGSGNLVTYPVGDNIEFEQLKPSIFAITPSIVPILIKDGIATLGMYITNPTTTSQSMTAEVRLSLPVSAAFWTSITGKTTSKDPASVKSKLLNYAIENLTGSAKVREETPTISAGSSQEFSFTVDVPDLAGNSFADQLANGLSSLSPASLISNVLGKIKGPLAKLIGDYAADTAISITSRTITAGTGEMVYPTLGMGTTTLYDSNGNVYDQDSFYFIYLR